MPGALEARKQLLGLLPALQSVHGLAHLDVEPVVDRHLRPAREQNRQEQDVDADDCQRLAGHGRQRLLDGQPGRREAQPHDGGADGHDEDADPRRGSRQRDEDLPPLARWALDAWREGGLDLEACEVVGRRRIDQQAGLWRGRRDGWVGG